MGRVRKYLFTAFAILAPGCVVADESVADAGILAADPYWLSLLHYHRGRLNSAGWESYVDDPKFFLSSRGKHDPEAELRATVSSLRGSSGVGRENPLCRFPARARWLRERLGADAGIPAAAECPEYFQWRERLDAHSVTLIFASAYLNSPSSMYGHTLLRIDPADRTQDSRWLSWAVNFGAVVGAGENSMLYAWRGLAGGYPGSFSVLPYYEKIKSYSRLENRDLWEYRLNLDPDETDRMVTHLWELRDINFDYYFLDENCSFRLLELLDVARPGLDLARDFPAWVIPLDTVRIVEDAGLVEGVEYRPAHATRLEHMVEGLAVGERQLVLDLAADPVTAETDRFKALPVPRQRAVALTAYRHLRYRHDRRGRDAAVAARSHALLKVLHGLGPGADEEPAMPVRPEAGHRSTRVGVSGGSHAGRGFGEIEVRASYHDLLDHRAGYRPGAAISMGRIAGRKTEGDRARLERFDLVEITSITPRDEFFSPISWQVRTGLEQRYRGTDHQLVTQVTGGAGLAWRVAGGVTAGFLNARLEYNPLLDHNLGAAPGLGVVYLRDNHLGQLSAHAELLSFGDGTLRREWGLQQHLEISPGNGIRFHAARVTEENRTASEWRVSWFHYF